MENKSGSKIGSGVAIIVLLFAIGGGYKVMVNWGWLSHTVKTEVKYPDSGWQAGEYVNCAAVSDSVHTVLDCGAGPIATATIHELDVKFYGAVGKDPVIFKCQLTQNGIVCRPSADK